MPISRLAEQRDHNSYGSRKALTVGSHGCGSVIFVHLVMKSNDYRQCDVTQAAKHPLTITLVGLNGELPGVVSPRVIEHDVTTQ